MIEVRTLKGLESFHVYEAEALAAAVKATSIDGLYREFGSWVVEPDTRVDESDEFCPVIVHRRTEQQVPDRILGVDLR